MKLSKFTNIVRKNDVYLLHNTLVNSIIRINDQKLMFLTDDLFKKKYVEDKDVNNNKFLMTLKELKILVPDTEDEDATLNANYFYFEHSAELYIMLIVTRRCNFRCAYCYEETEMRDMKINVFEDTIKFVVNQIRNYHFKNVYISFFGGEPTLMSKEIITFMKKLNAENEKLSFPANIRAMMTTNGYLLNKDMLSQFVDNKIVRYQITVDGLADSHNKSRYLANGQGTWETIINNLKLFKEIDDSSVSVLLRSNITPECYENIDEWLQFLHDNFSDDKYNFHFEAAKNYGKMNDEEYALIKDETSVIMDIIHRAKKWKLPLELVGFGTTPFSAVCYAARHFSYIIDCNGEVKKCTSSSLDEPYNDVGKISSNGVEIDFNKAAQWTSYSLNESCQSCDILPICFMRKCPASKDNYEGCDFLRKSYYSGLEYNYLD